jgi:ribonuclease P protein component
MGPIQMITSAADFEALQSNGKSRVNPLLVLRYRRNDFDHTRYGISTGRRIGTAVVRNRVRRRLRTVLGRLDRSVDPGWDVLVAARQPAATAAQRDLDVALSRLLTMAGLLHDEAAGDLAARS